MSDQDDKTVPTAPDEANAAETSAAPEAAEASPEGRPSALADALGEDPDAMVSDVSETPQTAAPLGDEPVAEPAIDEREAASETQAADPAAVPAADAAPAADVSAEAAPAETAGKAEPDYAALAAELDELEARHGAVRGAEPAPEAAPADAAAPAAAAAGATSSPWFERADETQTFRATEPEAPAVTASEPVAPVAAPAPAPQPVFVEAPEPPTKRGNRGAAGLIGLVAAVVFAVLTFAVRIGFDALAGEVSFENIADASLAIVTSIAFWIPVVAFFLAFWLIGALINNGRWVAWVLLGFVVGLIAYAGHVFAPVIAGPFWWLTQSEGIALIEENLLTPFSIAAFIIGREVTIWFGGWASKRGARMTALNQEAQAEYEKTLEAGPAA